MGSFRGRSQAVTYRPWTAATNWPSGPKATHQAGPTSGRVAGFLPRRPASRSLAVNVPRAARRGEKLAVGAASRSPFTSVSI